MSGIGWALTSGAAIAAMVGPWFKRRLGFALSLAFNGASAGGVLFTPLWLALIDRLGFSGAAAIIAAATVVVLWPLAGRYLRATPASLGLAPDGDAIAAGSRSPRSAPRSAAGRCSARRGSSPWRSPRPWRCSRRSA